MTPNEALEIRNNPTFGNVDNEELSSCIDKALEKQTAKKPIPTEEQNIRFAMNYTCPSCKKHFTGTGIADYCYHCGQALDWSDD